MAFCLMAIKACLSVCMVVCAYVDGSLIWSLRINFSVFEISINIFDMHWSADEYVFKANMFEILCTKVKIKFKTL